MGACSIIGDGILTKFKPIQAFIVLLSARMKKDDSKLKALGWSQYFSYFKSIAIFPDAQGQLSHSPRSDLAKF